MKIAPVVLLSLMAMPTALWADQTLWYGGDTNRANGLLSTRSDVEANVYDDFDIAGLGATVTGVSVVVIRVSNVTQVEFEIMSGVSQGNGGELIVSGVVSASDTE